MCHPIDYVTSCVWTRVENTCSNIWEKIGPTVNYVVHKIYILAIVIFAVVCLYHPYLGLPMVFGLSVYHLINYIDATSDKFKVTNEALCQLVTINKDKILQEIEDDVHNININSYYISQELLHNQDQAQILQKQIDYLQKDAIPAKFLNNPELNTLIPKRYGEVGEANICHFSHRMCRYPLKIDGFLVDARVYYLLKRQGIKFHEEKPTLLINDWQRIEDRLSNLILTPFPFKQEIPT